MPRRRRISRDSCGTDGVTITISGYALSTGFDIRESCKTRTPGKYEGLVNRVTNALLGLIGDIVDKR